MPPLRVHSGFPSARHCDYHIVEETGSHIIKEYEDMTLIQNLNSEKSPIWVVLDAPYSNDSANNSILSSGYGYNFKKIWKLGGISLNDTHIRSLRPCLGATYDTAKVHFDLIQEIEKYRPTIIVVLSDELLNYLVPETTQAKEDNSSLRKWAGSLLCSKFIHHPHYIVGSLSPEDVTKEWSYNEIQAFIDFGHVKEEFQYWKKYGDLRPLPKRNILVEPTYSDVISYLNGCLDLYSRGRLPFISVDIETLRPRKGSFYYGTNPGYPYTICIARSSIEAISFSLWDYGEDRCMIIWRLLNELLQKIPQIGQNYFSFDSHYLKAMGIRLRLRDCRDTQIRHHILWPSLKHALHFQTRQYTREPYYKDEGKNFNIKHKKEFMIYNGKDGCVTKEIYDEQEKEFQERPWLQ